MPYLPRNALKFCVTSPEDSARLYIFNTGALPGKAYDMALKLNPDPPKLALDEVAELEVMS